MQTDFFIKKWGKAALACLLALWILAVFVYAAYLSQVKTVWIRKSFYFLVSETEHIQASTHEIRLDGGAGYILQIEDKEYVAFSVYFDGEDGRSVQASMIENGENTTLLEVHLDKLYFKSCKEKKNSPLYQGALDCLYGCMEVLGLEIDRLDGGATQQSSFRTLGILLKQLRYLAMEYQTSYTACANLCESAVGQLSEILNGTVYTKDLRYLLCDLSSGYIRLSSAFSL